MAVNHEALVGTSIAQQSYEFSPRATVPRAVNFPLPVPGTVAFERVLGRAGDLIVIQLKSSNGERYKRREALRTLGLKGIRSASLRFSDDVSTWGCVEAVRDLVAVIVLPSVTYTTGNSRSKKQDAEVEVESYRYGTQSKPGHLWRGLSGAYFAYEYEADSLVTFWSSALQLDELLQTFDAVGMQIDEDSPASYIGMQFDETDSNADLSNRDGSWRQIAAELDFGRVGAAVISMVGGFEVTWQAPHARFHDLTNEWASIGVNSQPPDVLAVKSLCGATGDRRLLAAGECHVRTRQAGTTREIRI